MISLKLFCRINDFEREAGKYKKKNIICKKEKFVGAYEQWNKGKKHWRCCSLTNEIIEEWDTKCNTVESVLEICSKKC